MSQSGILSVLACSPPAERRADAAAQPPFESLRERRRERSTDEFDPSPHARRMCNLCGMTRTCSICRVSSVNSTPFASPHKFGVSRSPLSSGLRDRELLRATLSEGELMSTLANDSQRPTASEDGRKARSQSISRAALSRGTTVSSRMRDAYIDQETFRGRYGKMLAQYSSMQSLVGELKRELLQLSHSHDTPTEPARAGQQLEQRKMAVMDSFEQQRKRAVIDSFLSSTSSSQFVQEEPRVSVLSRATSSQIVQEEPRGKSDSTTLTAALKEAVSLPSSADTDANTSGLVNSLAANAVDLASGRGRGAKSSQTRTMLALSMRLWCSVLCSVRRRAAAVMFVGRRERTRGLLKEAFARWAVYIYTHLSIIIKMGEDVSAARDSRLGKLVLRSWRRFLVSERRARQRLRLARRLCARSTLRLWLAQVALRQRHRRVVLRQQRCSKHVSLSLVCAHWQTRAQRRSRVKRISVREHARCNRLLLRRSLDWLKVYTQLSRQRGPRQEAAHQMRLSRVLKAWQVFQRVHHRAAICLARAGLRSTSLGRKVLYRAWSSWAHYLVWKRVAPKMKQRAFVHMSQRYRKLALEDWRSFLCSAVHEKEQRMKREQKMTRVVMRIKKRITVMLVGFWREHASQQVRQRAKMRRMMQRHLGSSLVCTFQHWVDTNKNSKGLKNKARKLMTSLVRSTELGALRRWVESVQEAKRQRHKTRKLMTSLVRSTELGALRRWVESVQEAKRQRHKTRKLMTSLVRSTELGALRRWVESVQEAKRQRHIVSTVLNRALNGALAVALVRWSHHTRETKVLRAKSAKVAAVLANDIRSLVLQEWVEYRRQHRQFCFASKTLASMSQRAGQTDAFDVWRQMAKFSRMVRQRPSSFMRGMFRAFALAVRRQKQCCVVVGTLINRRGAKNKRCILHEWRRKVMLCKVVSQRCKIRGERLVTRAFHQWLRSALYTALMRKARHVMHQVHHVQIQEFTTRRAQFVRRFRASFYLWRMYVAVMYEAQTQQAKALRRLISNTCRPYFSSWTRRVEHARTIEDSTVRALHAATSLKNSHRMLIPVPFRKAL